MFIGIVKWFDNEKGFGVLVTPDKEEHFLHISSFLTPPEYLFKGTAIVFSKKTDKKKNRNLAENSHIAGELQDWNTIFNYLGKPATVSIEYKSFSIIEISAQQYFEGKDEKELIKIITHYFDNDLDDNYFIQYCEHIEFLIKRNFSKETSTNMLDQIFSHFGKNRTEQILFDVWKQKKFKFISLTDQFDIEIPESILITRISEIDFPEINRIKLYRYGTEFCSKYLKAKFSNIERLSSSEIKKLYNLLDFESENDKDHRKSQLDMLYAQQVEIELIQLASNLEPIKTFDDFNNYIRLLRHIPYDLQEENKKIIKNSIHKIIAERSSEEFKPELLVEGIIEEAPFEFVSKYFHNNDTDVKKRIAVLSKLHQDQQFELLKKYSIENGIENTYGLIEGLVIKENRISANFNISVVLFDSEFWVDKNCNELISSFITYVNEVCSDDQKYELFFKGYVQDVPIPLVHQNVHTLDKEKCKKIFRSLPDNQSFISDVLEAKLTKEYLSDFNWLYDLAIEFLGDDKFNSLDKKVFEIIQQSEYFKLWKQGKAKVFPHNEIANILNDRLENYTQIASWIQHNATNIEEICDFLFSYLIKLIPLADRPLLYKHLNHIKFLIRLNEQYIENIKFLKSDDYNLILWFLDAEEIIDFEHLKKIFIYFAPDEQVRLIRKLFFQKASGRFDLSLEKLDELTRFDLDLYKTTINVNPDIAIDISTDVVIKSLLSYSKNQRFIIENELFAIILDDLNTEKTKRFRLSQYFENCLGREIAEFDWKRKGQISKVKYGDNKFYFAITFEYDPNLIEIIKTLPGRKWNMETKVWGIPSKYEKEVLQFAINNRFYLDFEGNNYANNTHFAVFKRDDRPNGISFCEGRLANRPHEVFKKDFWWCGGQPCFSKCETIHSKEQWEKYTLLDFCEILGFNTDERNRMGDHIPKGLYYQFIALINRFNRLLEKLYCLDCNHILYPSDFGTGHFAAHTIVRFQCRNEACHNNDEIYLNHCLNGQCNCIIDSRVSKRCENGLFICANCGSCCSHNMLERRLSNLELTGGYIHDNLRKSVNEKLGHLERGEYFCYKCQAEMTEVSAEVFQCSNCQVKYETTKYKFKRPHKHLRKKKTTARNNEGKDNNPEYDQPL
jgi:cold shock CspA family protein